MSTKLTPSSFDIHILPRQNTMRTRMKMAVVVGSMAATLLLLLRPAATSAVPFSITAADLGSASTRGAPTQLSAFGVHQAFQRCALGIDNFFHHVSLAESAALRGMSDVSKAARSDALRCPWQQWMLNLTVQAKEALTQQERMHNVATALRLSHAVFNTLIAVDTRFAQLTSVTLQAQQLVADMRRHSCHSGLCLRDVNLLVSRPLQSYCRQATPSAVLLLHCHAAFHDSARSAAGRYFDLNQAGVTVSHSSHGSIEDGIVVTWRGYVFSLTGFGDEMRHFVLGLSATGVAVRVVPVEEDVAKMAKAAQFFPSAAKLMGLISDASTGLYAAAPVCSESETADSCSGVATVQAKRVEVAHALHAVDYDDVGSYAVLRVAWETLHPEGWLTRPLQPEMNADEIWATSLYNVNLLVQGGVPASKIVHIPQSIDPGLADSSRSGYPMPGRSKFNFLSVFAWQQRKGWDLLLAAFIGQFGSDEDVSLVVKASPFAGGNIGEATIRKEAEEAFTRLCFRNRCFPPREAHEKHESSGWIYTPHQPRNVLILFKDLNSTEVSSLYKNADAFVLPSRSEGWGRPYMEAMLHGLPVIGTGFGGQLDFMNVNNSFLIDYEVSRLSSHAQNEYKLNVQVDISEHRWAEPKVPHLRQLMLTVVKNPALASARGREARRHIRQHYTPEHIARSVQRRVQRISLAITCSCQSGPPCNRWDEAKSHIAGSRYAEALACLREHLRVTANDKAEWTRVEHIEDPRLLLDFGHVLYRLDRVVSASRALKQVLVLDVSIGMAHCMYAWSIARAATNADEEISLAFLQKYKEDTTNLYVQEALHRARDCVRRSPGTTEARRFEHLVL